MKRTIDTILEENAKKKGDISFVDFISEEKSLTFDALNQKTIQIESFLRKSGVLKQSKIAVLMENGEDIALTLLGIMRSGCVAVPLNPHNSSEQLLFMLHHSEAEILFIQEKFREIATTLFEGCNKKIKVVTVDDALNESSQDFISFEIEEEEPALLLYTSGTTGNPKGVLLSHKGILLNASLVIEAHQLGSKDKVLSILPLYHINGFVFTLIAPLVSQGKVVMPRKFSATEFWKLVEAYKITWVSAVPTIIAILNSGPERDVYRNKEKLRFVRSASMKLPEEVQIQFEERFQISIIEAMGITEATGQVFSNPAKEEIRKLGSIGIPFGFEAKIVKGTGEEALIAEEGEILIRGESLMQGYLKDPKQTEEAYQEGWFKTGDLGFKDSEGYFYITGRKKEIIIRAGENINPLEIDAVLYRLGGVKEAAAVGVPDPIYGEEVKAFLVFKEGIDYSEKEVLDFCKKYLPRYKCPKTVSFLGSLPKGPSGKIQRLKLLKSETPIPVG